MTAETTFLTFNFCAPSGAQRWEVNQEGIIMIFISCKCRKTAWRNHPQSVYVKKVEGGFICFETFDDYSTWKNQK